MKFHDIFVYSGKGLYMYFINTYFILIITRRVRTKISNNVEGIVLGLLKTKHTYRSIQKEVKSLGFSISLGTIKIYVIMLDYNVSAQMLENLCPNLEDIPLWPPRSLFKK